MELQVSVAPIERPLPPCLRVARPGDRESGPRRFRVPLPRRAAFQDRHCPCIDIHFVPDQANRAFRADRHSGHRPSGGLVRCRCQAGFVAPRRSFSGAAIKRHRAARRADRRRGRTSRGARVGRRQSADRREGLARSRRTEHPQRRARPWGRGYRPDRTTEIPR